MKHPAKSYKTFSAVSVFVLMIAAFSANAYADTTPKFVYVANSGNAQGVGGSISGYTVNPTTGALSPVSGSPFAAGSGPSAVAADPSDKFLYVANKLSNNVSAFTVDANTGALTQIAGSPFAAGTTPVALAVDPLGTFVYVVNQGSNNFSVFTLNSQTGALTPASGSPIPTGPNPGSVTVDPLGRFVYVSNFVQWTVGDHTSDVAGYSIDRTTNTLIPVAGSPKNMTGIECGTIDPSGKFFYVSIFGDNQFGVDGFSIDATTGALAGVAGARYPSGQPGPTAFAPSDKYFYAIDDRPLAGGYDIAEYSFDSATGLLSALPASPFSAGAYPIAISIDPSGKFVYVPNLYGNNVSAYSIDATTGNLTQIPGSPFAAGASPISVAIVSSSSTSFTNFVASADIDEDRQTSFRVAGFFTLADASAGIDPLTQTVQLQVGSFSATVPAGSFKEAGKHALKFEGTINGADLKITINAIEEKVSTGKKGKTKRVDSGNYLFTAEGKGKILAGIVNPVQIALTVGSDGGSTSVTAIIEK